VRWHGASRDGRIVKSKKLSKTIPHPTFVGSSLYTREPLKLFYIKLRVVEDVDPYGV
jgi:hypothetical protein